jgi:hypothetical protein
LLGVKGQLFSMDFLVAAALVLLALGIVTQAMEASQRRLVQGAEEANGTARALAASLVGEGNATLSCSTPTCCVQWSNGTSNCASLACGRTVAVGRRLTSCAGTMCSLEVRVCG